MKQNILPHWNIRLWRAKISIELHTLCVVILNSSINFMFKNPIGFFFAMTNNMLEIRLPQMTTTNEKIKLKSLPSYTRVRCFDVLQIEEAIS
jgi:hypothetical protein